MRAPEIGLLATVGKVSDIQVKEIVQLNNRVKVGVLSTGNELVPASTLILPPGKIRDSNKCMLMAVAKKIKHAEVIDLGTMQDNGTTIDETI